MAIILTMGIKITNNIKHITFVITIFIVSMLLLFPAIAQELNIEKINGISTDETSTKQQEFILGQMVSIEVSIIEEGGSQVKDIKLNTVPSGCAGKIKDVRLDGNNNWETIIQLQKVGECKVEFINNVVTNDRIYRFFTKPDDYLSAELEKLKSEILEEIPIRKTLIFWAGIIVALWIPFAIWLISNNKNDLNKIKEKLSECKCNRNWKTFKQEDGDTPPKINSVKIGETQIQKLRIGYKKNITITGSNLVNKLGDEPKVFFKKNQIS